MAKAGPLSAAAPVRALVVSLATDMWGAERYLLELAPLLAARHVELSLASPPDGEFAARWAEAGHAHLPLRVPHHRGIRPGVGRRPPLGDLAREAVTVLRSAASAARLGGAFHVLQSNSLWGHLEVALAGRLARRPVVLWLHDLIAPGAGRRLFGLAAKLSAEVIAISDAVASCVDGPVRRRVSVVHNGVDLQRFRPGPADPAVRAALGGEFDRPLVGIVGRIDPEKGVDTLVRAMERMQGPAADARLAVVGRGYADPAYASSVEEDARRRLGTRVRFVGARRDVPDVLRALDVVVNASAAEPFGLTVVEAQACGRPVVVNDSGGPPEFVEHEATGLVVRPGDVAGLAAALERLCAEPALRQRLGAAARRRVEERLDLDTRADAYALIYRRAAGR